MERLSERLEIARRALEALARSAATRSPSDVDRDAALLRLATGVEAIWKAAQAWLEAREGLEAGSPKACARAALEVGLLDEAQVEALLLAIDDRNLIVHAYTESLAHEIHARIPAHARVLRSWLDALIRRG